jgi:D-inositol-3-phosphate glycosyltransferase
MLEKRIGIIMYQTSNSKGQELVAQRMVRDFNKLGQKAYLITSTFHDGQELMPREGLLKNKGYYCVEDKSLNIPVIRVESGLAKWPPRRIVFRDFINTLNQIVNDFRINVLITHSTLWNGPEDVAKFVTWRRDIRNIGGYQDPIVFCHMSHFQEPTSQRYSLSELTFRTAWNKISLSKILEAANIVLVVTPIEKRAKIRMGAAPEKCLLYPGGVDTEVFLRFAAEDTTNFLKQHNIAPGTHIVSYLGTLEERKNPLAVLKVAQLLKDKSNIHFMLAGKADSAYGEEVIKMAGSLPNVTYLGEIDEQEKALLIRVSRVNILMSKLEALGITQLEFMYGGVPVVTSGVGGQSWVVRPGLDGFHVKGVGDIDGAARSVLRLVEDESLYKRLSFNARERAGKYASIYLTGQLDTAIEQELMKDGGLTEIPQGLRDTLIQTEFVLKSWSAGTSGIVATNKRIFIKKGWISRSVLGMRYQNIKAIEHLRIFPWKIPLVGAALSSLIFLASWPQWLFSADLSAHINLLIDGLMNLVPTSISQNEWWMPSITFLPLIVSSIIFLARSRMGFRLYGEGTKPVYLSAKFKKAIEFIRIAQDGDSRGVPGPSQPHELGTMVNFN